MDRDDVPRDQRTILDAHQQVGAILRTMSLTDALAVLATTSAEIIAAERDRNQRRHLLRLQDEMVRATVREMVK